MYKSVVVSRFGGPEVLQVIEKEIRPPGPNECRVRVLAAGVARVDIMMRSGLYPVFKPLPPFCPGKDFAGIVDAVGDAVTTKKIGELVSAYVTGNSYAEFIYLPESELVAFSEELDPTKVTCLPVNYITAYQMLHRFANVKPGEKILIHGAGSGVGTALIQLGSLAGLVMYGTASAAKHELINSLGAKPIDYKSEDFVKVVHRETDGGVDVVFDHVGGAHLWRSFRVLHGKGRLIAYGELSWAGSERINKVQRFWHHFYLGFLKLWPDRTVIFYELDPEGEMVPPEWSRQDLAQLLTLLRKGKINPVVADRIPLVEAARAHELLERHSVSGKLVLVTENLQIHREF